MNSVTFYVHLLVISVLEFAPLSSLLELMLMSNPR